jgi:UDP-4-amino-4,6-dideoxy-N-acetyl-beta-L-altrosamine N-acetyltransferase
VNVPVSPFYTFKNFTDLTEQESNEVLHGRNDPDVRRWMKSDRVIAPEEHQRFLELLKTSDSQVYFRVERNAQFVGVYSLSGITSSFGVGGFWISKAARERMLGLSVVFHSIDYLFDSRSIEAICGFQLASNDPATKLNRLIGFEKIARPDQADNSMIYLQLSREKWSRDSVVGTALRNLVELSERRALGL